MDVKDKVHVVYVKLSDYYLKVSHLSMLECLNTHTHTQLDHAFTRPQKWIKPIVYIKYVWRIQKMIQIDEVTSSDLHMYTNVTERNS